MAKSRIRITGIPRLILIGCMGALIAAIVASTFNPLPLHPHERLLPAAYRTPKVPGGTALRLAMVHDVVHERYLRHGNTWYTQRNIKARKIIEAERQTKDHTPAYFGAMDDLAVGLERLGQYDEAIAILNEKLASLPPLPKAPEYKAPTTQQTSDEERANDLSELRKIVAAQNLSPLEQQQYSTAANLGTLLVHKYLPKAIAGDAAAKQEVRRGIELLEQAIAINPGAHFGRENWQVIAVNHLLAATEHPEILLKYDLIGDALPNSNPIYGETTSRVWGLRNRRGELPVISLNDRIVARAMITRVGINPDWAKLVQSKYSAHMPFDEPTMAIIGMWTLGGGPNPHFAVTLGIIMEEVGQLNIAWNAYERAVELSDRFWPDAKTREQLVEFCKARQLAIAQRESAGSADSWQEKMRHVHQDELAWGLAYQKAYQDFEESQIKAGVGLNEPTFYDAFFQNRPNIASSPGSSDDFLITEKSGADALPCMVLGAGLTMLIGTIAREKQTT